MLIYIFSSSASPESGLGTSHTSLPGSGQGSNHENAMGEETYYESELEPLQPLGTCRALYPFEGKILCKKNRKKLIM